jgi:1-acylglycerone phosphate reductase
MPYTFGSVYAASKAALHSYSDVLRLELAPFDVRVVTVVTGGVKSNIARTERELPPNSIYLPLSQEYNERLTYSQLMGMPNEQYARSVVRQLLGSPSKDTIWQGGGSYLIWFARTFLPRWVLVSHHHLNVLFLVPIAANRLPRTCTCRADSSSGNFAKRIRRSWLDEGYSIV